MGEVGSVRSLTSGAGMVDEEILRVIAPPLAERDRSQYINQSQVLHFQDNGISLPAPAAYRYSLKIGRELNPATQIVRSNHFKVDLSKVVSAIHHYHVHIYQYNREGVLSETDCAAEEELRVSVQLLLNLRKKHVEWDRDLAGRDVGITYDGRSALFSTVEFQLPLKDKEDRPFLSEDVFVVCEGEEESGRKYRVTLTYLGPVFCPRDGAIHWRHCDAAVIRALDSSLFSFARWMAAEDLPEWFLVGPKAYRSTQNPFFLSPGELL